MHTVSLDEMTGIQALERRAPNLPMRPDAVERREFEYVRHGTRTLIAGFDVATGQVTGRLGEHRCEEDFAAFLEDLLDHADPQAPWEIVADNLNRGFNGLMLHFRKAPGRHRFGWTACTSRERHPC